MQPNKKKKKKKCGCPMQPNNLQGLKFVCLFVCMVFLRCMEPVVIQQRDQQLYVTSEPHQE